MSRARQRFQGEKGLHVCPQKRLVWFELVGEKGRERR